MYCQDADKSQGPELKSSMSVQGIYSFEASFETSHTSMQVHVSSERIQLGAAFLSDSSMLSSSVLKQ